VLSGEKNEIKAAGGRPFQWWAWPTCDSRSIIYATFGHVNHAQSFTPHLVTCPHEVCAYILSTLSSCSLFTGLLSTSDIPLSM